MKRKFTRESDFSEVEVEVNDEEYYILQEITRVHPQCHRDHVYFDENGKCSTVINRGVTREDKEINKNCYRISIEKM